MFLFYTFIFLLVQLKVFITDTQTTLFFLSIYFLLVLHESSLDYFLAFRTFFISDSENVLLIQLVLFSMNNLKYIRILCEFEIILLSSSRASPLPLWSFIKLSVTTDFFTFIISYNFNEIYLVSYLCNGITHSSSGHETVRFEKTEVHLKTCLWFYTIRFFQLINFVGFFFLFFIFDAKFCFPNLLSLCF